jgi:RND family efflux transporter MFP subunit
MHIKNPWKWAALFTIVLLVLLVIYDEPTNDDKHVVPTTTPASTAYIAVGKGRVDIEGGVIRLAAQRDGLIQAVMVEEGDKVMKGQVLARIDSRQAVIGVELATAELARARGQAGLLEVRYAFAQRDAKRNVGAAKGGAISKQIADDKQTEARAVHADLAAAKAAVSVAAAQLKQAEFEVEVRQIRAPFDGRIVRRNAKPGDGVSTLNVTELFQLTPVAPRIVRADIDEEFIDHVKVGMTADIISETNPDQKWQGKIIRIGEVFGSRKQSDDPNERQDVRVVDTVLSLNNEQVRIGQRMLVKILALN